VAYVAGSPGRFQELFPRPDQLRELRYHAHAFKRGQEQKFELFEEALAAGSTLYFKNVGRRVPPITEVVTDVRVSTHANYWEAALVCGNGFEPGYDVHRDPCELVVMQLHGTKRWTIYSGGEREEVAFSSNLQDGDMLYVPANWWHFCEPLGRSAHVTISFRK